MDDIYISADIEADGPIPGRYSMLSFGLVVSGRFDGAAFVPLEPGEKTFYRELRPISDEVDPAALAAAGLDAVGAGPGGCGGGGAGAVRGGGAGRGRRRGRAAAAPGGGGAGGPGGGGLVRVPCCFWLSSIT